jgi:flagellar hook protein FlgE
VSSFSTALSGLLADSTALDVVGDNLANMNTQGFKANTVQFEDALTAATASLQIGAGVGSVSTNRQFTQGSLQTTNGPLDAAIQGNGFFVVRDPSGATMYTRAGDFSVDSSGYVVTKTGDRVQGWTAVNGVLTPSGAVSDILMPTLTAQAPSATTQMTLTANLDASAATNDTFQTPIQVVDSLGVTHTLTVTFTKTAANAWSYDIGIPAQDLTGGKAGSQTSLATGSLAFDSGGVLTSPAPPPPVTNGVVNVKTTTALTSGAAALNINWQFFGANNSPLITQFAQASASLGTSQDGVQPAQVTGVTLQNGGTLVASYSNGKQLNLAQVALASVVNPDSLIAAANNKYTIGSATVAPSVGVAGTGDRGNVVGGSLESSNVDMATEFTNLIVFQRGYQANSKVITSIDQMEQALLAINP